MVKENVDINQQEPQGDTVQVSHAEYQALKQELEALKASSNEPQLTPEQIAQQNQVYEAELISYAVKEGRMKLDEFDKVKELTKTPDTELVFKNFLQEFKEDNPDIDEDEIEQEARSVFEDKYDLSSSNENRKNRGLNKIKSEANQLRSPLATKHSELRKEYDEITSLRKDYPTFVKKVSEITEGYVPEKYNFFNTKDEDSDVSVDLDISEEDRKNIKKEINKRLESSPEVFSLFKKNDIEGVKKAIEKVSKEVVFETQREAGYAKIAQEFKRRGIEKASVGSTSPFPLNNSGIGTNVGNNAAQTVIESLKNKK